MTKRTFSKTVLIETLKENIHTLVPDTLLSVLSTETSVTLSFSRDLTTQEDILIQQAVTDNFPSDSFVDERRLTDQRNAEGFETYKKIFAHISDNDAVTDIDGFIAASDYIHKLRNFLKDGNFETALRYFYRSVRPLNLFQHQELYRGWITEHVLKYKPELAYPNPSFDGTPYEGWTTIKYIEEAENA